MSRSCEPILWPCCLNQPIYKVVLFLQLRRSLRQRMCPSRRLNKMSNELFSNDTVCRLIAKIPNMSFHEGCFLHSFKTALVTRLIKKPNLDPNKLSNYRPISNVNNISKIVQKLVLSRLQPHILPHSISTHTNQLTAAIILLNFRNCSAMDHHLSHKSLTICQTWQLFVQS